MTITDISKLQSDVGLVDSAFGNMRSDLNALQAVSKEFLNLKLDMDNTDVNHAKFKFMEWHRMVVILSQLLHHTVKEMDSEHRAAHQVNEELFHAFHQMETEKTPI